MSSRTIATNSGAVPGVAARANARPARCGSLGGDDVEVVHDLHVVGDEPDRYDDHRGYAVRREPIDVVADVRLEPRLCGRTAAALEDELPRVSFAPSLGDESGRLAQLRDVVGSVRHRERKAVRGARDRGRSRTSSGREPIALARLRANGPTKPGWS